MDGADQGNAPVADRSLRPVGSLGRAALMRNRGLEDQTSQPLVLQIDGFEGPLDVLLTLCRTQKVDLSQISILELVEQYLSFISDAKQLRLELAADYLVMAAWLAYLKSKLLLPKEESDIEPSAEEMALRLQFRLQKLEAMREAGARLMAGPRLGRDFFVRGNPEGLKVLRTVTYDLPLYVLLKAYTEHHERHMVTEISIERRPVMALEEALERLSGLIGEAYSWTTLKAFLPDSGASDSVAEKQLHKSEIASMFAASLELARQGQADIRQMETFGPLYLKGRRDQGEDSKE